ncbi:ABC transporter ATP-binding protein [Celeribacter marinus]|uniref:Lipid A export ATP-binding/permease protein MsbA n=1 Tax=Celeribacter marinus TaxID=1397108 RepID=A0A0P0AC79_9RHOB|nr:lipid A export ATP-binding/permease protein MsbA [Celeribacter marinus]SFK41129.1 ABC-type multidrug transport system, ATPase and permease component [Celeribacter marinus]
MSADANTPNPQPGDLLRWFFGTYLRPQSKKLGAAFFFMVVEGAMLGLISYLIKPMFDDVLVAADTSRIAWTALAILGVFAIRALSGYANRVLMTMVRVRSAAHLQGDLLAHVLTLDGAFFHNYPPGVLLERTRGDCQSASDQWGTIMRSLVRDVIGLTSLLIVAATMDWQWTLLALVAVPFIAFPIRTLQRRVRRNSSAAREASSFVSNRLDEVYHGTTSIKLAGTEQRETDRFNKAINGYTREEIRSARGQSAIPSLIDFVAGVGFASVLYFGGLEIISGEKTVGEFMAFFTAVGMLIDPARRLGNVSAQWQIAMASMVRVHSVFNERPSIVSPPVPKQLDIPARDADVVLEAVAFSYTDAPVLRGTSFVAKAGQTTALVGASGAGKSTIFHLLARLADPQSGSITIGGTPTNQLDLKELRGLFSVVSQDALLFDESIRENVMMGADASDADLQTALKAAHVDAFLGNLEAGVDTNAGTRGSALSGGQRQRVAIARAVLRDRPILLLDEATSALDAQSEKIVQEALEDLSKSRTTLVIAHRLSTIRNADSIVVMDRGMVVDQGTHDELLARGGLYADLYRLQYSDGMTLTDRKIEIAVPDQRPQDTAQDAKDSGFLGAASRAFGSVMGLFGRRSD